MFRANLNNPDLISSKTVKNIDTDRSNLIKSVLFSPDTATPTLSVYQLKDTLVKYH